MKIIALVFSFWSIACIGQISILNDTILPYKKSTKFRFERFNKKSSKKISAGRGVTINLTIGDTNIIAYGWLINADNQTITINPVWRKNEVNKNDYSFSEYFHYKNSTMLIDVDNIKNIQIDSKSYNLMATLGLLSLTSALVASPLISIDKSSPDSFNVKRYKPLVFGSIASTIICFTYTFFDSKLNREHRLSPKVIKKYT